MRLAHLPAAIRWPKLAPMRPESRKHLAHGRVDRWDTADVLLNDAEVSSGQLDLPTVFGNHRPVEIEIGTGKGTFLLARACARPEVNFLGIEYARSYCLYAADRMRRAGLTNVRMTHVDAGLLFRARLRRCCAWRVHIYFPDPWPKRRHHRRRLIQPMFARELRRTLLPGGQLLIVTDHLDYSRWISSVLDLLDGLAYVPFPTMTDSSGQIVGTNFERKYITQGRRFFKLARMRYI